MPNLPAALVLVVAPLMAMLCGMRAGWAIARGRRGQAIAFTVAGVLFALGDLALMMVVVNHDDPMAQ
jgi:ribose/xylose/arabinose/galactoside ABC-type transport system permease subunit